ncbi:ROK family protein [Corynebacterium sp. L4756]|uniref:ROK family protein n=1 Tax=unclassified Corynebacterium TaxID=2624378 RepID=UPI00374D3A99
MNNASQQLVSSQLAIGFDIGGTNIRAGVVDAEGQVLDTREAATPKHAADLEESIEKLVTELRVDHDIQAVGLAVAGFIDPTCTTVRFAPHLPWRNAPVRDSIQERIGLPVRLEHDANSAAWGENRFGAGKEAQDWVFFAIGTGIGATLMAKGEIYRGAFGTAPEFGHLTVVPGGRECSCGKAGCLERYASGTALPDIAVDLGSKYESSLPVVPTGEEIVAAARAGDPLGIAVMEEFGTWLGQGLAMVADVLDPELIVLGGGVSRASDLYLDIARQGMQDNIVGAGYRQVAELKVADLGSQAGMIGAADLARASVCVS